MTKWKKNPKKKKKYPHSKVPTVKLCIDCKRPNTRKSERCTACEMYLKRHQRRRREEDEIYRQALRKHRQLDMDL